MDSSAEMISFDEIGQCSYCTDFLTRSRDVLEFVDEKRSRDLKKLVEEIKRKGKGKKYDCIIGVSGGVDSSWVLVQAVNQGLRPLAVHMDNGWNSELAQNNISNLLEHLGVDLFTYVIDWTEYRRLMQAFFDADVIDIELLYDNAMLAVNYSLARKYRLRYILSGSNAATEGMKIPPGWTWYKYDVRNIKAIARQFGNVKLKSFPSLSTFGYVYNRFIRRINWIPFPDFFRYDKTAVLNLLESEYGYRRYPYKHYESVFTRFYQGYILPNKFGIDKRRVHLSTLVISGQISRNEALKVMELSPYPTPQEQEEDIDYFLKKMRWSKNDLSTYLSRSERDHDEFASETIIRTFIRKARKAFK